MALTRASSGEETKLGGETKLGEDLVTPWEVAAAGQEGVDYTSLANRFGVFELTGDVLQRLKSCTKSEKLHPFLRRGFFYAHRELEVICERKEKSLPFYLYTGRGPSSESLHLGHLVPFMMNKWLQDAFDVPLVVQMTDDEKFLFKQELGLEETYNLAYENAKDIIACGFDKNKTFIFRDVDYIQKLYPVVLEVSKRTTFNQVRGIFGFNESSNIGKCFWPAIEAAPCFAESFPGLFGSDKAKLRQIPCLIPCAIDQDPYFRMARDIAPKLQSCKPTQLYSKFIPALQGFQTKMSGSMSETSIFVSDSPADIRKKVLKYAFSGGQESVEEHRKKGADLAVDVSYQYLTLFLEDDAELEKIGKAYSSGEMLTSQVKERLIECLIDLTSQHQKRRAEITDDLVSEFMNPDKPAVRKLYG